MTMATDMVLHELELEVEVRSVVREAEGVVSLTLALDDGRALPPWTPGAHIDLILPTDGDEPLVRQYSLCGDTRDRGTWQVGILRTPDSRGGSEYVHDRIAAGDTVRVRGPRNHFTLVPSRKYLFIGGGIGITPLLPMIAEAAGAGADWTLVYGGRSRGSMAFLPRLADHADRVRLMPEDEVGRLDLGAILSTPTPDTLIYCCGPEGLLDAVEAASSNWPAGSLHLERFSAKNTGGENTEFDVILERSGVTLTVPADKSIYQVCKDNGIAVLGSCLEGICGTCETDIVDGEADHRDVVLDDDERAANTSLMICVSRCRGRELTLDL